MIYGYARCSTNEKKQDIDRQKRDLKKLGVDPQNIFWEYQSGMKNDRVQLDRLMNTAHEGDTIIVLEVSRLTRSTQKLCSIIDEIKEKKLLSFHPGRSGLEEMYFDWKKHRRICRDVRHAQQLDRAD